MTAVAICFRDDMRGMVLACELRRMGEAVSTFFTGKVDKQFKRAQADGARIILMLRPDMTCRIWWRWRSAVETTFEDVRQYLLWLADESDNEELFPQPPEYLLQGMIP